MNLSEQFQQSVQDGVTCQLAQFIEQIPAKVEEASKNARNGKFENNAYVTFNNVSQDLIKTSKGYKDLEEKCKEWGMKLRIFGSSTKYVQVDFF